jgi:hypothetical protein
MVGISEGGFDGSTETEGLKDTDGLSDGSIEKVGL